MSNMNEQLTSIEKLSGSPLPADFRAFLLSGEPLPGNAVLDVNDDYAYINEVNTPASILEAFRVIDADVLPRTSVPFATDGGGNIFCVSVAATDFGAVYYLDFERDVSSSEFRTLIAPNFGEFLQRLEQIE
jgi:hypothetical protein